MHIRLDFVAYVICDTDRWTPLSHNPIYELTPSWRNSRCACQFCLTFFLVIGTVLFGGLILVSSQLESKPLPVSQRIGVPLPFKALPDETQSQTGSVDSADESNVRD